MRQRHGVDGSHNIIPLPSLYLSDEIQWFYIRTGISFFQPTKKFQTLMTIKLELYGLLFDQSSQ